MVSLFRDFLLCSLRINYLPALADYDFRKCLAILVLFCVISYLTLYLIFYTRDWWEVALLENFPQFKARNDDFAESLYRWILYISPYPRLFESPAGY